MGVATMPDGAPEVSVALGERRWDAVQVSVPNPHAVVFVESLDADVETLAQAPVVTPAAAFPDGVNVEFAERVAPGHVRMRVHERGVGETRSCGTGACAVAWVEAGDQTGSFQVDVPGGTVWVDIEPDGPLVLRGPAELVARGTVQWPRGV